MAGKGGEAPPPAVRAPHTHNRGRTYWCGLQPWEWGFALILAFPVAFFYRTIVVPLATGETVAADTLSGTVVQWGRGVIKSTRRGLEGVTPTVVGDAVSDAGAWLLMQYAKYPVVFGVLAVLLIVGLAVLDYALREWLASGAETQRRHAHSRILAEELASKDRALKAGERVTFVKMRKRVAAADARPADHSSPASSPPAPSASS
jgi:hypothetical protein